MKYIRTKDGRILKYDYVMPFQVELKIKEGFTEEQVLQELEEKSDIIKQADTIEELCDELVIKYQNDLPIPQRVSELKKCMELNHITWEEHFSWLFKRFKEKLEWVKLAIYTDKGLIYIAKMNDKGELELL